ncbi:hypothetical protein B0G80_1666 [Paraburkholderia sp. BL6669N2]|uniref:hypothetical protein n=1 Tax=Paraburkholderia sp. BL6669N2 TaxID=1938807 RepID=UPI000E222391|nr:hypothetical protein [Paraburkholderia sp. BL6669N2]REG58941.1 hypothetical protein B0G80_1666 [Paraburkholderia sp. BL6669N2]
MGRWTQNQAEAVHISRISQELPIVGIVRVFFKNGQTVEGALRGMHTGNNAGEGGVWRYRAGIELETLKRQKLDVDLLDVSSVVSAWDDLSEEYERNGLIKIIDLPKNG